MRLAWFTPLPPDRSGIAAYSVDILPLLAARHEIDVFVDPTADQRPTTGDQRPTTNDQRPTTGDQRPTTGDQRPTTNDQRPTTNDQRPIYPSYDFTPRHQNHPYDLVVYQLGNATCHDYMWPYLVRYPGLVVLHDAQLHQARSKALLTSGRHDDYLAEFAFCHPDANPGIANIVAATLGGKLFFLWPLNRVAIESARLVGVHSPWLAASLAEQYPAQEFRVIEMGVGDPISACHAEAAERRRRDIRARHRIPANAVLFAAYGMLTPEKRLGDVFKALQRVLPYAPDAHLMLVGQPVDYYDVEADARDNGVADHVTVTGYVSDEDLPAYLAASDVCLCLRWPTSRETSASWLRCLAAGKPTIITDLLQFGSAPALDPRDWTVLAGTGLPRRSCEAETTDSREAAKAGLSDARTLGHSDQPACVAIDILDEQHSLGLAMRRLATDGALRRELGCRAREYWRRHHTLERMAECYEEAIEAAIARPAPDRSHFPAHLLADGTGLTNEIVGEFGLTLKSLDWET